MNNPNKIGVALASMSLGIAFAASAASHEPPEPSFSPVEIYTCKYNQGKTMADLMRVVERWNAWMDQEQIDNYWAFTMVPLFHSEEIDFDVAWTGGWPDGASMAAGTEHWITKGGALQAEFAKVVTCSTHANFAVLEAKASPDPWRTGPVEFSNCSVKEGRTIGEALEAVNEWVAYQTEHGTEAGHFILFPAYGESSEADYDFKWVSDYSYQGFGHNYDQYGTGGGWRKAQELFERLLDCDSARLYHATPVRTIELEQ